MRASVFHECSKTRHEQLSLQTVFGKFFDSAFLDLLEHAISVDAVERACTFCMAAPLIVRGLEQQLTNSYSSGSMARPNTSPYSGLPCSSTGGLPQPPGWYPNWAPGGMGALRPEICIYQYRLQMGKLTHCASCSYSTGR